MTVLTLALLTSLPVAAFCWLTGALIDRNADRFAIAARMREGVWSGLLALPAVHVVAVFVGARLLPATLKTSIIDWEPARPVAMGAMPAPVGEVATPALALPWPQAALAIMALGAVISLAVLALRHARVARLTARARPCDRPDLAGAVARRAAALGIKTPAVLTSPDLTSPRLAGLRRPAILLPDDLATLPVDELSLICGHELAHLKLHDNLRLAIEDVLLALFWFNPAMRAIRGRLAAAREEGRDDLALAGAAPETRRRYAETLVQTLRLGAGPEPHAAFIGAGRNIAAMRLNAILKPRPPMSPRVAVTTLAAAASLSLVVAAGSGALAMVAAPAAGGLGARTTTIVGEQTRGGVTFIADRLTMKPDGRGAVYEGAVEVRLDRVTGDPVADARLAGVTFLIDGRPAPAGFDPTSLRPEQVLRVDLTAGPIVGDLATYQADFILGAGTKTPSTSTRSRIRLRSGPPEPQPDTLPKPKPPAPTGSVDIVANEASVADNRTSYRGDVEVRVKPVTGKPWIDVRLAGAVFHVNGEPAPKSFDPASIDRKTVKRVDVTTRTTSKGRTYSMIDFIMSEDDSATAAPQATDPAQDADADAVANPR